MRVMHAAGASSRAMADALDRTVGSIASRRRVLGLLQDEAARLANIAKGISQLSPEVLSARGRKAGKSGWTAERRKRARRRMRNRMRRPIMKDKGNAVILANPEIVVRRTEARMQTILGWCPEQYRADRRILVKKLGRAEADRIIREQIATDKRRASEAEAKANGWSMAFQAELERARAGAALIDVPPMPRAAPEYSPMGGSLNF
jgi:hypothetical protein